jgi:hypothetical protein
MNEVAKKLIEPYKFDVDSWLDNLLLDEDRETYRNMTTQEKKIVRFAYIRGCMITEHRIEKNQKNG